MGLAKLAIVNMAGYDLDHTTDLSPPVAEGVDNVCQRLIEELTSDT